MLTLTPAYGRDYKSGKAAKADFAANKDFIIQQIGHPYDGKYANREQLEKEFPVMLRFNSLRSICIVKK